MSDRRKWCDLCGDYVYPDDEPESECCYLDCPMSPIAVRDTGDDLGKILGEALRKQS